MNCERRRFIREQRRGHGEMNISIYFPFSAIGAFRCRAFSRWISRIVTALSKQKITSAYIQPVPRLQLETMERPFGSESPEDENVFLFRIYWVKVLFVLSSHYRQVTG